ncbi:hypothetical protein AEQ67_13450 [Pseudomonas sp. RIT-PI-q]|uniref:hypothetical protein n=1 Tax=Pseudomonas sp. RIT-PI-q TaxID=1690247 RepID=UPI0006CD976D|nr:hypothetical protein [Pseudomonas sp. RIT-PI-q]KPG98354.1 hypothetical protein AEQ67_13450 [Pseudomonas sp. RIT-PI-q]
MTTINVKKLVRQLPDRDVAGAEAAVVFTFNGKTVHVESFKGKVTSDYLRVVDIPEFDAHSSVLGGDTQFEYEVLA